MNYKLHAFLLGVVFLAATSIGIFFYRFWRRSRDRLFVFFAVAFWLLAVNWGAQAFVSRDESYYVLIYLLRLLAFVVIIVGVVAKNRGARSGAELHPHY